MALADLPFEAMGGQPTFEPRRVRGFDNHRIVAAPLRAFMRLRTRLPIPMGWI